MAFTLNPPRQLGPFTPQVTIEERSRDSLVITEHPVEQGAQISDHTFKMPAEIVITAGWTNGDPANTGAGGDILSQAVNSVASAFGTGGDEDYINQLWQQILDLQASGNPFQVVTARRTYDDMLIRELESDTDEEKANTLWLRVVCRQVILVEAVVATIAQPQNLASPEKNAPVAQGGARQLQNPPPGTVTIGQLTAGPVAP